MKTLDTVNNDFIKVLQLTSRIPKPGKELVILTDASYDPAGFVIMIEDYMRNNTDETSAH